MKNTFIVNKDFLDSLSKKIYENFGIQDFDYDKNINKEIKPLPVKFYITNLKYTLQAKACGHTIQIFFDVFKYYKTLEE